MKKFLFKTGYVKQLSVSLYFCIYSWKTFDQTTQDRRSVVSCIRSYSGKQCSRLYLVHNTRKLAICNRKQDPAERLYSVEHRQWSVTTFVRDIQSHYHFPFTADRRYFLSNLSKESPAGLLDLSLVRFTIYVGSNK